MRFRTATGSDRERRDADFGGHHGRNRGLANYLDGEGYELRPESAADLRRAMEDARLALDADTELDARLRTYISRLLHEIEIALDNEAVGSSFDFGDAVERLFFAFKAAKAEGTTESGLWEGLVNSIIPTGIMTSVIEAGSLVAQLTVEGKPPS